jgi:hypothetical protein
VQRNLIKGLATYNILQNPFYKESFGITWKFAVDHKDVRSVRRLKLRAQRSDKEDDAAEVDTLNRAALSVGITERLSGTHPSTKKPSWQDGGASHTSDNSRISMKSVTKNRSFYGSFFEQQPDSKIILQIDTQKELQKMISPSKNGKPPTADKKHKSKESHRSHTSSTKSPTNGIATNLASPPNMSSPASVVSSTAASGKEKKHKHKSSSSSKDRKHKSHSSDADDKKPHKSKHHHKTKVGSPPAEEKGRPSSAAGGGGRALPVVIPEAKPVHMQPMVQSTYPQPPPQYFHPAQSQQYPQYQQLQQQPYPPHQHQQQYDGNGFDIEMRPGLAPHPQYVTPQQQYANSLRRSFPVNHTPPPHPMTNNFDHHHHQQQPSPPLGGNGLRSGNVSSNTTVGSSNGGASRSKPPGQTNYY